MIQLKYLCTFVLHKRAEGDTDAHLVCRVKWNGTRSIVSLNVGYVINPEKWDAKAQLCEKKSVHGRMKIPAQRINNEITRFRQAADSLFAGYAQADIWPTVEQVRSHLRIELGMEDTKIMDTMTAFDLFLKDERVRCSWSEGTWKKMRTVRQHIADYEPFASLQGFTTDGLTGYMDFLRTRLGHNDVTVHRQLGYVRWFCAYAYRRKWMTCDDFVNFKPKLKAPEKPVVFLKWDELMRVWTYESKTSDVKNYVRDIFLFSCFTSLRFSDVQALTWGQVGEDSIRVVAQKTAKTSVIELNKWSSEILERYIDVSVPGGRVFPRVPNQVCNRYLKNIAMECGIDDPVMLTYYKGGRRVDSVHPKWGLVCTHTGRRTFICNALAMGIPPTVVMQWTGHADFRAMKSYINIADETRAAQMRVFNSLGNGDTK